MLKVAYITSTWPLLIASKNGKFNLPTQKEGVGFDEYLYSLPQEDIIQSHPLDLISYSRLTGKF